MTALLPEHCLRLMDERDRKSLGKGGRTAVETLADMEARSEKELQEQICSLLRRREIPFIRPSMFKRSELPVGWPDISFAYRGKPIAWECKVGRNTTTAEQNLMIEKMTACGWRVSVIRTLSEALETLKGIES
jgi:hypothetical protein